MLCLSLSDIANITVKGIDSRCIIHDISKSDVINLLENSVLADCGIYKMHFKEINMKNRDSRQLLISLFNQREKTKKIESKSILIDEKNCKDLKIYFT